MCNPQVDQGLSRACARALIVLPLLLLPWLWPFVPGPSSTVVPWLVGATCVAVLVLTGGTNQSCILLPVWMMLLPLIAWCAASLPESAALGGGLLVISLAAGLAAGRLGDCNTKLIVRSWWIAAALSAGIALLQYFALSRPFAPWVSVTEVGTAYANLRQRNQFASLMALGLAALLWEAQRGMRMTLLVPLAACVGLGNAASISRTGLFEFLLLAILVTVWPGRARRQIPIAGCALAAYGVGVLLLPTLLLGLAGVEGVSLWQRVTADTGCGSRRVLWSNVLHLIAQKPWTGWGWGELDYAHYMTLYPNERFCDILDNAHNLPLHLAVELGVPVTVLACGAGLWAVWRARPWREMDPKRQLAWSVLAVILLHSMVEYPLWYVPFQIATGLCIGILWSGTSTHTKVAATPWAKRHGWPPSLAALCLAAVGYVALDYHRVSQLYLPPESRDAAYRSETLTKVHGSWLFRNQVDFAELTTTPLTLRNAEHLHALGTALLHFSPEPRVIRVLIESAVMTGRDDEALAQTARFRAAFPVEYKVWRKDSEIAVAPI